MKTNIKQEHHYALSKAGVLTHIKDAKSIGGDYFCPHCKCRMIKKCGQIRQWHFAHDKNAANEIQRQCTYETYLHSYAKMRLEQWFNNSVSIIIRYNTRYLCNKFNACKLKYQNTNDCSIVKEDTIDIKKLLNKCDVEKGIIIDKQGFRPDLIWYNDKKKIEDGIFIEVKVTHGCTEAKKNSSARIIEFEIESEEDVDKIISNEISENDYTHFYGFKIKTSKETLDIPSCNLNRGNSYLDVSSRNLNESYNVLEVSSPKSDLSFSTFPPGHKLKKFILNKNGKGFIRTVESPNYLNREDSSCFELTLSENYINNKFFFKDCYFIAKGYGLFINTCLFCKHGPKFSYDSSSICNKSNRKFAIYDYIYDPECSNFEFDDIEYSKYQNNIKACNIVDIWVRGDSNKTDYSN